MLIYDVLAKASDLAMEIEREASKRIRQHFRKALRVETKRNASDLVSDLDREIEQFAKYEVCKHFPDHSFLGEEYGEEAKRSEWLWVLDPLDGTQNYLRGIGFHCFSLAICYRGNPVFGVISDPFHMEVFTAKKGQGSWCNGEKLRVRKKSNLQGAVVLMEMESGKPCEHFAKIAHALATSEASFRVMGSSALSLAYVASGRADVAFIGNLNPWDVAAGILLVEEAEGTIRRWDGHVYHLFQGGGMIGGTESIVSELLAFM